MSIGAGELQQRLVAFVRAFGLHRPDQTPCGAPVATSEAHALEVLSRNDRMTQNDLAHQLGLTKSTVSRLVDQLECRDWVQREHLPGDGRCRVVSLTAAGAHTAAEIARLREARMAGIMNRIPQPDRASVLAALEILVEASHEK